MSTASPPSSPDPLNRASIPPGWGDTIVLLGRILIGGIFVQSGFDKLMGLDAFAARLAARGLPAALGPVLPPTNPTLQFFPPPPTVFCFTTRSPALPLSP